MTDEQDAGPSLKYRVGKSLTFVFLLGLAVVLLFHNVPLVYNDLRAEFEWSTLLPHVGWLSLGLLFLFQAFDYLRDSESYDI